MYSGTTSEAEKSTVSAIDPTALQIGLLGSLDVAADGERVNVTGRQARIIISQLALNVGTTVTTEALIDAVWPEDPPAQARKTIQVYISNLRKAIGGTDSGILSVPNGYSLSAESTTTDIGRFEALLAKANAETDAAAAVELLTEATGLWRGVPFEDLDADALRGDTTRLNELRIVAIERRIELELELGRHHEVISPLEALTLEHPFRERLRAHLMLALYRSGRQADALRVYAKTRDLLAEELGLEPSRELQQLELQILEQSADLDPLPMDRASAQTFSFLVTDIEDSTALWEANPEGMTHALARHDDLLHEAVVACGGEVFKGTGDGVMAVFSSPADAVRAAEQAQQRLAAEPWNGSVIKVRMGIDTGTAEYRNADYFGQPLNRACRVMSSGHGGQVLLTQDVVDELDSAEGPAVDRLFLGPHSYKGVGRLDVHQLMLDGLPNQHAPLAIERPAAAIPRQGFDHTIRGYELRERLGEGDFGIVYRAYQASVGREVAIKVIRPEYANRPSFVRRFEVEAQLVAQIEHPHVVSLYDYWRDPDGAYLVMRWLRGGNLRTTLDRGPLNPPAAVRLLDQVGSALASAHRQGVVHRDIKPANVLLDDEGNAYLSDFGIASRHVDTEGGPMSTSPAYVSPEEVAGQSSSTASDIYALGMLAFEVLTSKRPPATGALPKASEIQPALSPAVDDVLARATATDPNDRYDRTEDFLRAVRQTLGADVVATEVNQAPDTSVRNPYRGLQAFQETDAADFFGRDALVDELAEMVERHPLVAVVGPSGSGKSSVVRAGLLPQLRKVSADRPWFITDMFPGAYPFEELANALQRVAVTPLTDVAQELRSDDLGLTRMVKQALPDDDTRLLLIIDQFEELFSLTSDATVRDLFIDSLVAAANNTRGRLTILVTIRADFFHRPLGYGEFGDLMRDGLVPVAMPTAESLTLAIARPARGVGLELEPGLVNEVVRDVADQPGGLPLMQHALSELFQRRQGRTLTLAGYQESGGVLGALTRRADEIYRGLSGEGRLATRQVFLRLVRADEASEDTRRRVRLAELQGLGLAPDVLDEVLSEFGQFRILSFDRDTVTRGPTVEVGHEAVIREWGLLKDWVDDRRSDLLLQRRLDAATTEWVNNQKSPGFLLSEGRLGQFESWADGTDVRLTAEESEFLGASSAAAAEGRARAARRRNIVLGVAVVFAMITSALAVFALRQRNDAREATEVAESQTVLAGEQEAVAVAEAERANEAALVADQERSRAQLQAAESRALQLAAESAQLLEADAESATEIALEAVALAEEAGLYLPSAVSALYNATFADRRVRTYVGDGVAGLIPNGGGGPEAIDLRGELALQPTAETEPLELFTAGVEVVDLATGDVMGRLTNPAGFSGYIWDPVTGDILTLSLAGELVWYDPVTLAAVRTEQVEPQSMNVERVGDLINYSTLTDPAEFDLQTRVVDANTMENLFTGPPDAFVGKLSNSGAYITIMDDLTFLRTFDIESGEEISTIVPGERLEPMAWSWHPNNDSLLYTFSSGLLQTRRFDVVTGELLESWDAPPVAVAKPDPTGVLLAAGDLITGAVHITGLDSGEDILTLSPLTAAVRGLSWSGDSRRLLVSYWDGTSQLWDLGEGSASDFTMPNLLESELAVSFDFVDQGVLFHESFDGQARLVSAPGGEVLRTFPARSSTGLISPIASNAGDLIAAPEPDTTMVLLDAVTGEVVQRLPAGANVPLAFSPDDRFLLTTAPFPTVEDRDRNGYQVFDLERGEVVFASEPEEDTFEWAFQASFLPDGQAVLQVETIPARTDGFGSDLGAILGDDVSTTLVVLSPEMTAIEATVNLDFSFRSGIVPDGRWLVAGYDQVVDFYPFDAEVRSAGALPEPALQIQTGVVIGGDFSADSETMLLVGSGFVRAYRTEDLSELWTIDFDEQIVSALEIEDGVVWVPLQERVFGSEGTRGLVGFPLDLDELVTMATDRLSQRFTDDQCELYLGLSSCDERAAS